MRFSPTETKEPTTFAAWAAHRLQKRGPKLMTTHTAV